MKYPLLASSIQLQTRSLSGVQREQAKTADCHDNARWFSRLGAGLHLPGQQSRQRVWTSRSTTRRQETTLANIPIHSARCWSNSIWRLYSSHSNSRSLDRNRSSICRYRCAFWSPARLTRIRMPWSKWQRSRAAVPWKHQMLLQFLLQHLRWVQFSTTQR